MQHEPWPLEYPGARARGWRAHDVAVTRHTPINVGAHAVPVVIDATCLPHVLGYAEDDELADEAQSSEPDQTIAPANDQSRTGAGASFRSTWRFLTGKTTVK